MKTYDLIVIGGGRASNLAVAVAESGKSVALIERDTLGGTCPNRGCVPSKLLIGFAEVARKIQQSSTHYIDAQINSMDVAQMFSDTNDYVARVDERYESRHPKTLDLYRGHGAFVSDHVVEVDGNQLTAQDIVIATGGSPRPGPFQDLPIWTSDDLFPLEGDVPKSITIVGGGFIAVELANFFDAVGVETTVMVINDRLLSVEDDDIAAIFKEQFTQNVNTRFNTEIESATHDGEQFTLQLNTGETHQSEALLYAIGRQLNIDTIGLKNTSIKLDENGGIVRDEYLQTSVPGVYAIGDVATRYQLQHIATFESSYVQARLLKQTISAPDYGAISHAVFSYPEVAATGLTESDVIDSGRPYVAVTEEWSASARAMSKRLAYPRTKLIVDASNYEVIGCHLIGPESSTMIHQIMMLMHLDNDIRKLVDLIHIHPALPEVLLGAAKAAIAAIEQRG